MDLLTFLNKLLDAQPLMVLIIVILVLALTAYVTATVAKSYFQREQQRDKQTLSDSTAENQKDASFIALANTLALQGARALEQQATANEILKRQTTTMENQESSYSAQAKAMVEMTLQLRDLAHAQTISTGKLEEIKKLGDDISDATATTQATLMDQDTSNATFKGKVIKDMEDIQKYLKDLVEANTDQTTKIRDIKEQMEKIVLAISLMVDKPKLDQPIESIQPAVIPTATN